MKPCWQATRNQAQAPELRPARDRTKEVKDRLHSMSIGAMTGSRLGEAQLCKLHRGLRPLEPVHGQYDRPICLAILVHR